MYSPNRNPTEQYYEHRDERSALLSQEARNKRLMQLARSIFYGASRLMTVAFWVSLAVVVGWIATNAWDDDLVVGQLGQKGARAVDTLLYGAVALTSGALVLYHRLTSIFIDPDYKSDAEIFYDLALFFSLIFGIYSFLGWYYY